MSTPRCCTSAAVPPDYLPSGVVMPVGHPSRVHRRGRGNCCPRQCNLRNGGATVAPRVGPTGWLGDDPSLPYSPLARRRLVPPNGCSPSGRGCWPDRHLRQAAEIHSSSNSSAEDGPVLGSVRPANSVVDVAPVRTGARRSISAMTKPRIHELTVRPSDAESSRSRTRTSTGNLTGTWPVRSRPCPALRRPGPTGFRASG